MAIRRRGKKHPKSSGNRAKPSDIRGVSSINPIDVDVNLVDDGNTPKRAGGPIGWIHDGISTLGSGIGNAFKAGASSLFGLKTLSTFTTNTVGKIASVTNLSTKVVSGVLIATLVACTGTGGMMFANYRANNFLIKQEDSDDDCLEDLKNMTTTPDAGPTGTAEEYAAKAWAVAKAFGLSDEQAAGMLGNMEEECGMDPTTIEGIYDEPFNITAPQKAQAVSNMPDSLCDYTRTTMAQKYINSGFYVKPHTTSNGCTMTSGGSGTSINSSAYEGSEGHFFCGIGLFGFTGPEGNALFDYANSTNGQYNWYDFDLQMAFIFDTTGGYDRAAWVESWKNQSVSSASEAAVQWNLHFEGNASNFKGAERADKATKWYNKFKGQQGDATYAQSIIALANTVQGGSQATSYSSKEAKCDGAKNSQAGLGNASIAEAAVAYAYETTDQGNHNNGTQLYQTVHDRVFPTDDVYQSCDRGVATAVRWSGADDNFPSGNTDMQDAYMASSPNWEFIGEFQGDLSQLQPGDILITTSARLGSDHGHVVVYVSNEIVKKKFPNSDASFVSASYGDRSPGCETWSSGKFVGKGYYVYRNKQKSNPSQYTDVVKGLNLQDR